MRRFVNVLIVLLLLLSMGGLAPAQADAADTAPRLVVFEGFYNPG